MVDGLKNCARCGELFAPPVSPAVVGYADEFCESCLFIKAENSELVEQSIQINGLKTITEISEGTGISRNEVRQIVESSYFLSNETESDKLCSMCDLRPTQPGSRLCLRCRLNMHSSLMSATEDIASNRDAHYGYLPNEPEDSRSVGDTLEAKRRRTGSHRFGGIPRSVKKY